jgi:hypothetical protein
VDYMQGNVEGCSIDVCTVVAVSQREYSKVRGKASLTINKFEYLVIFVLFDPCGWLVQMRMQ